MQGFQNQSSYFFNGSTALLGRGISLYWLLGRKSKRSISNKLLIYKTILKPIWTYTIQLWDTASTSNIESLDCFQ
jgi:hypothetical protein